MDSFYEYLVKGSMLLDLPELMHIFTEARDVIEDRMNHDSWYFWVQMQKGAVTLPVFQNLEAFWPGVLSLIGK